MASAKALPRVREHTGDPGIDRAQTRRDDVAHAVNQLAISPDAQLIRDVSIGAGGPTTVIVKHKLRRSYKNWLFVRIRNGGAWGVTEGANARADLDASQLTLVNETGAPATLVDILIW